MFTLISIACNVILFVCALMNLKEVKARRKKAELNKQTKRAELHHNCEYFIIRLNHATTLQELFTLHIQLWASGIQNKNLGPCSYGMFRTQDILKMTPDEVFLGNIDGLFTKSLSYWSQTDNNSVKEIVTQQYKRLLLSNVEAIKIQLM